MLLKKLCEELRDELNIIKIYFCSEQLKSTVILVIIDLRLSTFHILDSTFITFSSIMDQLANITKNSKYIKCHRTSNLGAIIKLNNRITRVYIKLHSSKYWKQESAPLKCFCNKLLTQKMTTSAPQTKQLTDVLLTGPEQEVLLLNF